MFCAGICQQGNELVTTVAVDPVALASGAADAAGDALGVEDRRQDQEQAADMMGVSRHTFGRILADARGVVAEALVTGKALRIRGGTYEFRGMGRRRRRRGGRRHSG